MLYSGQPSGLCYTSWVGHRRLVENGANFQRPIYESISSASNGLCYGKGGLCAQMISRFCCLLKALPPLFLAVPHISRFQLNY